MGSKRMTYDVVSNNANGSLHVGPTNLPKGKAEAEAKRRNAVSVYYWYIRPTMVFQSS